MIAAKRSRSAAERRMHEVWAIPFELAHLAALVNPPYASVH
jgi:hypothetical protein